MSTYLVTYDLSKPETSSDYERLFEKLRSFENWARPLQSVWIIKTVTSKRDVLLALTRLIDTNDKVLVVGLDNSWMSYNLSQRVVDWLQKNLNL